MALSITELELQTTEYLPARDVMTSLPSLPKADPGALLGSVRAPVGSGGGGGGALGLLGPGLFKNLAK